MSVSGACGISAYQPHHQRAQPIPAHYQMLQMDQKPTTSNPDEQQQQQEQQKQLQQQQMQQQQQQQQLQQHQQLQQQHQLQQQQTQAQQQQTQAQQQWQYGRPEEAQSQYHHAHQERLQYPRPPSRSVGPASSQTAHWMNQHYMSGGNWAYAASPAPSIAPSVISQSQYPADDRMSMLSVNTAITGQGDIEAQRCFSSNGSTQENINPDMAFVHFMRDAEYALQNWFTIRDPIRRCEFATKLHMWLRNKGLLHLDDAVAPRFIEQIVSCVADGLILWTPPNTPPPPEYMQLAIRLFEVFHKLVQQPRAIPIVATIFSHTEGQRSLKELLFQFMRVTPDQRIDRFVYIVMDFVTAVLQMKNEDVLKVKFVKALKCPNIVHALIYHLHDSQVPNVNILVILRNIISRDTQMKDYLIRIQSTKEEPLPKISMIRIILECVLPRCVNSPPRAQTIISQSCHLLRTLLYDAKSMSDFVKLNGVHAVCLALQRFNDIRTSKDALNLFLHVSDSPAFQEVDIPLPFIVNVIHFYHDSDIFKLGTGFLSNIVANKPKFKLAAIQHNAIPLLHLILSKIPRFQDVNDEKKRQLECEIMSNCLRTLINLLPFWVQNAHAIFNEQERHNQIVETVNNFLDVNFLHRFMSYLSCDVNNREMANLIEVRSHILRFIGIVVKMPFIVKNSLLDITDDVRKDNIIGHILITYAWASQLYQQHGTDRNDKEQREKLVERAVSLVVVFMDFCNAEARISSQCRYSMACPFDLIRDTQNESFIRIIIEFCDKVTLHCEEILTNWTFDRALLEGFTNNRNANIAKAANSLLSRLAVSSEPLADVFANTDFY